MTIAKGTLRKMPSRRAHINRGILLVSLALAIVATRGVSRTLPEPRSYLQEDGVVRYERLGTDSKPVFWSLFSDLFNVFVPKDQQPWGKSIAFLAGVAEYDNLDDLDYTHTDLEEMRKYLLGEGGFDVVYEVRDELVTRQLLENYMLNRFSEELGSEDRFIFYYTGHGATKNRVRTGFIQFSKARMGDFSEHVLRVRVAKDWSLAIPVKHALFIFDACASAFGLGDPKGDQLENDVDDSLVRTLSGNGSRYIVTAGTADQSAYQIKVSREKGFSVFTNAFLASIRDSGNRGYVLLDEVMANTKKLLAQFSVNEGMTIEPKHWPVPRADNQDSGNFIFLNPAAAIPNLQEAHGGLLVKGKWDAYDQAPDRILDRLDLSTLEIEWQFTTPPRSVEHLFTLGNAIDHAFFLGDDELGRIPSDLSSRLSASLHIDYVVDPLLVAIANGDCNPIKHFTGDVESALDAWNDVSNVEDPAQLWFEVIYDGPRFELLFPLNADSTAVLSLGKKADDIPEFDGDDEGIEEDYITKITAHQLNAWASFEDSGLVLKWKYGPSSLQRVVQRSFPQQQISWVLPEAFDLVVVHDLTAKRDYLSRMQDRQSSFDHSRSEADGTVWSATSTMRIRINDIDKLAYSYHVERLGHFQAEIEGYDNEHWVDYSYTIFRCSVMESPLPDLLQSTMLTVRKLVAEQLNTAISSVEPASHFVNDLGADELDLIEIGMACENEFGIPIAGKDVENLPTVSSMAAFIEEHLRNR